MPMTTTATTTHDDDAAHVSDDLDITRVSPRGSSVGGRWVEGRMAGHEFQALVFPQKADDPEFEVEGDSRISKLWVRRLADRVEVYNWDRGPDVPAADPTAAAIVAFLAAGLAEFVFEH